MVTKLLPLALITTAFTLAHAGDERCFKDMQVPASEARLAWSIPSTHYGFQFTSPVLAPDGTLIALTTVEEEDGIKSSIDLIDTKAHTKKNILINERIQAGPVLLADGKSFLTVSLDPKSTESESFYRGDIYSIDGNKVRSFPLGNDLPSGVFAQKNGGFAIQGNNLSIFDNDGSLKKKISLADNQEGAKVIRRPLDAIKQTRDGSYAYIEQTIIKKPDDEYGDDQVSHKLIFLNPDGSIRTRVPLNAGQSNYTSLVEVPSGEFAVPQDIGSEGKRGMVFYDGNGKIKRSLETYGQFPVQNFVGMADGSLVALDRQSLVSLTHQGELRSRSIERNRFEESEPVKVLSNGNLVIRGTKQSNLYSAEGELLAKVETPLPDPKFNHVGRSMVGSNAITLPSGEMVFSVIKTKTRDAAGHGPILAREGGMEFWTLATSKTKTVIKRVQVDCNTRQPIEEDATTPTQH